MKVKRFFVAVGAVFIAMLACNLPAGQSNNQPDLAATQAVQESALTLASQLKSPLAPPVGTATVTATFTPSLAQVSVTVATNCRTGPGSAWDVVWTLDVGAVAEVVGRNTPNNYWIIKMPGGGTCWLWGQYAVKTGPEVAEMEVPATTGPVAQATPLPTVFLLATPMVPLVPRVLAPPRDFRAEYTCMRGLGPGLFDVPVELNWTDASDELYYELVISPGGASPWRLGANTTTWVTRGRWESPSGQISITYSLSAVYPAGRSSAVQQTVVCPSP